MLPESVHPCARQQTVEVVENVRIALDTYRIRLVTPETARAVLPGQFFMLRLLDRSDPLLGRPFALYDTYTDPSGQPAGIDVVYIAIGRMSRLLARIQAGEHLSLWGPLGNGFSSSPGRRVMMVAGGIGQTPFLALARWYLGLASYGEPPRTVTVPNKLVLCYGVRTAELLAGLDDFKRAGVESRIASDDGTAGHHGFVTDLVAQSLAGPDPPDHLIGCGPLPMLDALAKIARKARVRCELSLETPMACGFGACFSCVVRVRDEAGAWDYRRVCLDGPVFDAEKVMF